MDTDSKLYNFQRINRLYCMAEDYKNLLFDFLTPVSPMFDWEKDLADRVISGEADLFLTR